MRSIGFGASGHGVANGAAVGAWIVGDNEGGVGAGSAVDVPIGDVLPCGMRLPAMGWPKRDFSLYAGIRPGDERKLAK